MTTISRPRCHTMLLPVVVRPPHPSVADLRAQAKAAIADGEPWRAMELNARADHIETGKVAPALNSFDNVRM
jgi:hypothetical protein